MYVGVEIKHLWATLVRDVQAAMQEGTVDNKSTQAMQDVIEATDDGVLLVPLSFFFIMNSGSSSRTARLYKYQCFAYIPLVSEM